MSIYHHWKNKIPGVQCIPLELKGRGSRWSEPFYNDFKEALDDLLIAIKPYFVQENQISLFGHSMGALLAYELTIALQAQGKFVEHLFLSGRSCPQSYFNQEPTHLLEDELFIKMLTSYGAEEAKYLQDRKFQEFFLPILKNDFFIIYNYKIMEKPVQVTNAVHVLYGGHDKTTVGDIEAWSKYAVTLPEYIEFQGGHFFLREFEPEVIGLIHDRLIHEPSIEG